MHRRAETIAALGLALTLSACAPRQEPVARDFQIGAHRVRVVPPRGWEVIEHGRQHLFRNGESQVSLTDVLQPAPEDTTREQSSDEKVAFVFGTFSQSDRREIARRDERPVNGRLWTEVHTWNRISHMDPARFAYAEAGRRFLVLATDRGPIEVTGPAFDTLLATIEAETDTSGTR